MNTIETSVGIHLSRFAVIFFLYGAYCVLFGVSIYVLFKRKRPDLKLHLSPIVILFIFVNAGMLCNVISLGRGLSHSGSKIPTGQMSTDSISQLIIAHQVFYILSNTVGELVLLYRVYVIWSSRVVTIIPSIFILADLVVGLAGTFTHTEASQTETSIILFRIVFMVLNFVTNLMLTMLLAFKICHIGRHALRILGLQDDAKRYKNIVAIIFESGIMYPLALLLFLILEARSMSSDGISSGVNSGSSSVVYEILPFVVAIAPTLVLVRSWLGLCVVHLDQTISLYQPGARGDEGELSEGKVAANLNLQEGCTIRSTDPTF